MAFQDIITIESPQFYIDFAFKAAKKRTDLMRSKKLTGDKLNIIRQIYLIKIETVESKLVGKLDQILQSFPRLDDLDDFYKELVKVTMDYPEVKKSLGGVNWAITKIKSFSRGYKAKIKQCQHYTKTVEYQKQYFGRISSVIKQIKDELHLLEDARKVLKHFPTIKTSLPTVAIVGFPNIGKTTLLYKLTGSKPEIDSYAFTTKSINTAYLIKDKKKIQFMDTPGTLNRFNKMNNIEKQAYLALEFLTHHIIYVFDLTEPFPLKEQIALYKSLLSHKIPITIYLSKVDLLKKDKVDEFSKKFSVTTDIKELKSVILKKLKL